MTDVAGPQDPAMPQRTAANPEVSAWVAASAGTGKTRVLTDRVLRLMLDGAEPGRVLCLTFTKAAAAEMANRLNKRLAKWAMSDDEALAADLQVLIGGEPSLSMMTEARRLFARVLDVPGGLKIQTIHAFCQSLLARFPLEAGLPSHFQVMDERTAAETLLLARDRTLVRARRDDDLRQALETVTARAGEMVFAEVVAALAGERRWLGQLFAGKGGIGNTEQRLRRHLRLAEGETEASVLADACDDGAFDKTSLALAAQAMMSTAKGDQPRGEVIANWIAGPANRAELFDDYAAVFLTQKGAARVKQVTKPVSDANPDIPDLMSREADRLIAVAERLAAVSAAEATAALMRVGDALLNEYQAVKRRHARLDYDDLILHTRDLLDRADAAAWVLYKLDGGLDHLLIDEAQDTNPDQWAVIKALASEFFAGEGAREGRRTAFAVGDAKQSIYSFQRADPAAFSEVREHFARAVREADEIWRPVELAVSFRSTAVVLGLVDRVFSSAEARDGLIFDGGEVRHFSHRPGQAGLVELWPTVVPEANDGNDWALPLEQRAEQSPSAQLAGRIAGRVRGWIDGGEKLPSRGRAMRWGDIMILVQRRASFVREMIAALKAVGVPVAGSDRMALSDQLAVQDLLAAARFVLLPEDDLTLAEVLKGPFCNLDDDDLLALAHKRGGALWRELQRRADEQNRWTEAQSFLSELLARADFAPPYEFFAHLLGSGGGRRKLKARLGVEVDEPVDEFLALSLQFEQSDTPSLQGFVQWLGSGEAEVKRDPELARNEVRVMTVHGAKGLQAPVVILPDTVRMPGQDDRLFWPRADDNDGDDGGGRLLLWPGTAGATEPKSRAARAEARLKRDQEYRRLFYVALTRAEDRLYICGWETTRGRPDDCWYEMARLALEDWAEPVETADGLVRRREDAQDADPDKPDKATREDADAPALPPWATSDPPPEPAPPQPLAPSRPEGVEPPVRPPLSDGDESRFLRGRLIHRLLQSLPDFEAERRKEAGLRFLANPAHGLDNAPRNEILGETLAVLEHPEFAAIFGPGSRAEVTLAGALGDYVVSGQVDRLLVADHEVLIVDYKTNRPAPESEDRVAPVYVAQMAAYRAALKLIYPEKTVRCALLWTDEARLMPLSDSLLDSHQPAGTPTS